MIDHTKYTYILHNVKLNQINREHLSLSRIESIRGTILDIGKVDLKTIKRTKQMDFFWNKLEIDNIISTYIQIKIPQLSHLEQRASIFSQRRAHQSLFIGNSNSSVISKNLL